jgi:16S rRNA (cytosine967-C5)-methyltransferase
MKYDNQLRYAVNIIKQYDGRFPLSVWLKDFFRENKQMGSRDRKTVSHLVYSFYRLGHSKFDTIEERVLAGIALCNSGSDDLVTYFKPEGIDKEAFGLSFLKQPLLFLRVRPGKQNAVLQKLEEAGVDYKLVSDSCISLPNTTKADSILQINKEVVIQDISSQKVGRFMKDSAGGAVWDCCAASGGKSIMAYDLLKDIRLTVSDVRTSIIGNLHERFEEAGIKEYDSFTADLTDPGKSLSGNKYDLIIADVPCSGSGTWARTPEQLYFFDPKKIHYYTELQRKIVAKVIPALNPGGVLLYITCSVFKSENEEAVQFIKDNSGLTCTGMEVIEGYKEKADTMFAARFTAYQ